MDMVATPLSGPLTVRAASEGDGAAWNRFVDTAPDATFFHRFEWARVLREAFGHDTPYLIALRGETVAGVLPLVHLRSRLFGSSLSSIAFGVEGGPVASDAETVTALDRAALALMQRLGAPVLEYRSRAATRAGWTAKSGLYATFARPLSADHDANLKAIPRKQRAVVRKTLEGGLVSVVDQEIDRGYAVYAESVRNLGTPVFGRRYFRALKKAFGAACDMVVVLDDGRPVSAVMNFYFRDTVLPYYGGGLAAARATGANDFLYWEVMRRAADAGYGRFDFGRSKAGTGAFAFKKNWGFEPQWLEYEYFLAPGESIPEKNPLNPRYARFIALWQRLPLPVANLLGPFLARSLG